MPAGSIRSKAMFALAMAVSVVALAIVAGMLWLRSPWGNAFVRDQIERRLDEVVVGEVELGSVSGDPLTGVTLHDFALVGESGIPLIVADRVRATYALRPFFDQKIVVNRVELVRPEIHLVRHPDGRWNFQTLWKEKEEPEVPPKPGGWGSWIHIRDLEFVDASVEVHLTEGEWPVLDWSENRFVDLDGRMEIGIFSRDRNRKRFVARDLRLETTAPPIEIRRLDGEGIVTPDSVILNEIDFVTPGTTIRADGAITLAERDSFAIEVSAPRLSMEEIRRFFPQVRIEGTGSFEGRLTGPAGDVRVVIDESRVDTGRSEISTTGTIEDFADPRLDLSSRLSPLAPADARAFIPGYPVAQPVSGSVRITGPSRAFALDADLRSAAGAVGLRGELDFRGPATAYELSATSRGLDVGAWIGRPAVDLVLTGRYRLEGSGFGPDAFDARVSAELGRSRIYRWDVVSLETRGRLAEGRYVADTLVARMPESVVHGAGAFGLSADGVIRSDLDLATEDLGEVWPGLGDWVGGLRADARLEGTYRGFGVDAEVAADGLEIGPASADSFAGAVELREVAAPGFAMEARGTLHEFSVAGIRADTVGVDADWLGAAMTVDARFDMEGEASARAVARIDPSGPATTVTVERLRYESPEQRWRMEEGSRLAWIDRRLVAEEFRLTQDGQAIRVDGTLALEGESDLSVAAEDVALSDLARLLGRPPGDWRGRLDLRGSLRGPRTAPVIEASGTIGEGSIRGFRFRGVEAKVDYEDRLADVDVAVTTPTEGHALVLVGEAPIDLSLEAGVDRLPQRPIDLELRGRNTDLSLLGAVVPGLEDLAGPVEILVEIGGTTEAPRFEGRATVRNGRMTIPATGVRYTDIQGRIRFNNDRIVVEELSGSDREAGSFGVGGTISIQDLALGEFDLEARARNLFVLDQDRRSVTIDGDVKVGGTTERPVLTGRVVVDDAIYRLPERTRKDVIDLEEAVIYVDIPGAGPGPELERSPSLWTRSRLDMEVVVTDDAILQSDQARIEIAGDLSLLKPSGSSTPTLSGTLQVKRGFYEQFGRRFTIEGGEIFFFGTPELNPGLNVVATRTVEDVRGVGDVEVRITLGGTLKNPTIDLSSTPPFEKSEIISIALFGSPTPAAGQERRFGETVQGLLAGAAAAPLEAALAEELNLDTIEISQRTGPGGDVARLFRIGKFLSPDVFVVFEQEFGGAGEVSRVALRYQVTEMFTLQATAGTGRRVEEEEGVAAGIDLFWEFTY